MKSYLTSKLFLILICLIFLSIFIPIWPYAIYAKTLSVGDGKAYSTIQAAINAASSGDTIQAYEKSPSNIYNETINSNGLNNIILIGMVSGQGVIIDGTGVAQLGAGENVRISAVTGWKLMNITFKEGDSGAIWNVRLAGGGGHTITKCKFASTGNVGAEFHELSIRANSTNNMITQNIFAGSRSYTFCMSVEEATSTATIKYNDFGGSNVYVGIKPGTTGNNCGACTIEYNYFHPSLASNALGMIYVRDTAKHSIKYNLIVVNANASGVFSGIHFRDNADNLNVQHNTVVFTGMTTHNSPIGAFVDTANINDTVAKNNIVQGGNYGFAAWDTRVQVNASITYNYIYNTASQYVGGDGSWAVDSNNTKTNNTPPGFAGSGTVWQTNGTDAGTVSQYYSLQSGAPALTACEGGTYCGAFRMWDEKAPSTPTGLRIIQ